MSYLAEWHAAVMLESVLSGLSLQYEPSLEIFDYCQQYRLFSMALERSGC